MTRYEDDFFEEDMINAAEMAAHQPQDDDTVEYPRGFHTIPDEDIDLTRIWVDTAKRVSANSNDPVKGDIPMPDPDSYEGKMSALQDDYPDVPAYYLFPDGVQVKWISSHLTSNGGQALQYVARSCRLDGRNKGERVKDLRKAVDMIEDEIWRIEDGGF